MLICISPPSALSTNCTCRSMTAHASELSFRIKGKKLKGSKVLHLMWSPSHCFRMFKQLWQCWKSNLIGPKFLKAQEIPRFSCPKPDISLNEDKLYTHQQLVCVSLQQPVSIKRKIRHKTFQRDFVQHTMILRLKQKIMYSMYFYR